MGDDVKRIKDRLDIVDVIGDYVKLTRSGQNHKGLCPFHDEKTPSFHVSQARQTWHCFGCGKGGDVFTFVMEKEGLTFGEALDSLSKRAGIALQSVSDIGKDRRNLYDVMEYVAGIYCRSLTGAQGNVAQAYLSRRSIDREFWSSFQLGWAPPSWDFLIKEGRNSKLIDSNEMVRCGLIIEGERGFYDRFRGRVIFPIKDISGKTVAFGGRIIDGDGAKYLNSPETEIYSKRRTLYLIDKAKSAIREKGHAILVEGYFDAIRAHIRGFHQTVATLGTALTEDQASIIKRLADRVYICYDADGAGQNASIRGMYILQSAGLSVKVVRLPKGKDPDDILSSPGGDTEFSACLRSALSLVDYHITLMEPYLKDPDSRKSALEGLFDGLSSLDTVDISPHLPRLSAVLGIRDFEVLDALRSRRGVSSTTDRNRERTKEPIKAPDGLTDPDKVEMALVTLLWHESELRRNCDLSVVLGLLSDERLKLMSISILSGESCESLERRWLETGDSFQARVLAKGGAYLEEFPQDFSVKWELFCSILRRKKAQMRYNELRVKMLQGQASSEEIVEHEELRQILCVK
ncbi:MAG: DNA primase [Synergistales bacterium]|nr:DNA primase [Synergistales bacterium]